MATGTIGSVVKERQEKSIGKMQSSSLDLVSYPSALSLNQINKHGVTKVALSLQANIDFAIDNGSLPGTVHRSKTESSKGSNMARKPDFHLANHVFYFKSWENQAVNEQIANANRQQDNHEMITEDPDVEVIDMEAELRQPRGQAEPNRNQRNRNQPKPNELLKNLDGLNISDNLKAKFLNCLRTGDSNNVAPAQ